MLKRDFSKGVSLWIWRNIKSSCFEEPLQTTASEWEAPVILQMRFWSFTIEIKSKFLHFFSADFLLGFFFRLHTIFLRNIYLHKKCYKYCWCMKRFLDVIKVLLVYNSNYFSLFPPGGYLKNLMFDLTFKWDVKT